jgi:hypothetical protein
MITSPNSKQHLYTFRGAEFMSDEETIRQLNYALALNRSTERYEKVKPKPTRKSKRSTSDDSPAV